MEANIVTLPGDGIGPEVTAAAVSVLETIANRTSHQFLFQEHLIGGCAMDACGIPLPEETLKACLQADAVLLGAVGGPKWDDPTAEVRPEQGLLGLRKALGLFANLRPVKPFPELSSASPLRPELLQGVDLLVIRELTGGIYFGQPSERRKVGDEIQAIDTMIYSQSEIRRVARLAFETAGQRKGKVTSVDKANILETSRLWRQTVSEIAGDYPDVTIEHLLVDAAAMHLISRPATFDVILTSNLFGDILTDEASVLSGSIGNLPSASLGETQNRHGFTQGLFEPIHGSAPDIAGHNIANPIGAILSSAMMLHHSLGLSALAERLETSVLKTLKYGHRTADLVDDNQEPLSTSEMTRMILNLERE
jgi:3-isopropylmalate dehydrogenase